MDIISFLRSQGIQSGCPFANYVLFNYDPSSGEIGNAVYFDFVAQPVINNVLLVWSDDCQLINQSYDPLMNIMTGRFLIDYGKLRQLCAPSFVGVLQGESMCL